MKRNLIGIIILALAVAAYIVVGGGGGKSSFFGPKAVDFKAFSSGGEVGKKSFLGEYKIVYFGENECAGECAERLTMVSSVVEELGVGEVVRLWYAGPKNDGCDEMVGYFYDRAACIWGDGLLEAFGAKIGDISILGEQNEMISTINTTTHQEVREAILAAIKR